MKKYLLIIILAAFSTVITSCHKSIHTDSVTPTNSKGYLVVTCANCQIEYGMPDQYKLYSVSGTSTKYYFSYTAGYTLVAYLTAFTAEQDITLTIYNASGNPVYTGQKSQGTDGHWEVDTIVQPKS